MEIERPTSHVHRTRTEQRLIFEGEVARIRETYGDLEIIRNRLGLSRRAISRLLLVDPSAWTRWTRGVSDVPPHIYRSLEFYLAKQGASLPPPPMSNAGDASLVKEMSAVTDELRSLKRQNETLLSRQNRLRLALLIGVFLVLLRLFLQR